MKLILTYFVLFASLAMAVSIELPYEITRTDSGSPRWLQQNQIFKITNVAIGANVLVSIEQLKASVPPKDTASPIDLARLSVTNDLGKTVLSIPIQVLDNHISFTLERKLWRNATLQLYVSKKHLPKDLKPHKDRILYIDISTYKPISVQEFMKQHTDGK